MKKDSMKKEKSCGAVVYREKDSACEVLLIKHKNGGHWAFPKGHVEKKETEEETALREIWEETGLRVSLDTNFRHVVTYSPKAHVMKDVVYFAAKVKEGEMRAQPEEVMEIRWETPDKALETVTYENDKAILSAFLSYMQLK